MIEERKQSENMTYDNVDVERIFIGLGDVG